MSTQQAERQGWLSPRTARAAQRNRSQPLYNGKALPQEVKDYAGRRGPYPCSYPHHRASSHSHWRSLQKCTPAQSTESKRHGGAHPPWVHFRNITYTSGSGNIVELRWEESKSRRIRTPSKIGSSRHDRYIIPRISTIRLPKQDGIRVRDDVPTRGGGSFTKPHP